MLLVALENHWFLSLRVAKELGLDFLESTEWPLRSAQILFALAEAKTGSMDIAPTKSRCVFRVFGSCAGESHRAKLARDTYEGEQLEFQTLGPGAVKPIWLANSDGLQPKSDGLEPKSDGFQPTSDGLHLSSDGLQPNSDGL